MLGYCGGIIFTPNFTAEQRYKILTRTGFALILFFIVLRFANNYGDPIAWTTQRNGLYTFLSFLDTHKYTPSLFYFCITIGPALLFLAFIENIKNRFTNIMLVFGRTAFFYYILHFYLLHLLLMIVFFVLGKTQAQAVASLKDLPFLYCIRGEGFSLAGVYAVWAGIIVVLYPLCK